MGCTSGAELLLAECISLIYSDGLRSGRVRRKKVPGNPPRAVGKTRTREHIIADLAVHHVEGVILRCGHVAERVHEDYGYDLLMTTFGEEGKVDPGQVRIQVKATDQLNVRQDVGTTSIRVDRRDLRLWIREIDPVVLVVYDAQGDRAFWLYMQPYLEQRSRRGYFGDGKITVRIPTKNRVNRRAIKQFARWRDANREIAVRSTP
jgi:hypothetical protein